jgi:hypothetical protein
MVSPKVVCPSPLPLPDTEVTSVNVRKRIVTPAGIACPVDTNSPAVGNRTGSLSMQSSSSNGNGGGPRDKGAGVDGRGDQGYFREYRALVERGDEWCRGRRKGDGWKPRG